jgi:predicted pyridoxine 5'-phosphate oxidase superfamily flavin-nucleotide-binding protein
MKLTPEIKQMLDENIIYLATSKLDGKPNVVPVGLVHAESDNEILIVDVRFNRTRNNLEENPQVALSFTDIRRSESYQIKGAAKIFKEGEIFEKAVALRNKIEKRKSEEIRKREIGSEKPSTGPLQDQEKRRDAWSKLRTKSAVLVTVEEVYSNMYRPRDNEG